MLAANRVSQLMRAGLILGLAYFVLAYISIKLFGLGGGIAVIWFANAVGTAGLSRHPPNRWPLLLVALLTAIVLANGAGGVSWGSTLLFAPGNMAEMLLGAYLLRTRQQEAVYFYNLRGMFLLIWLGVMVPVAFGTLVSATVFGLQGTLPLISVAMHWVEGGIIGGTSMLPAAYWLYLHGWHGLRWQLAKTNLPALLLFALAIASLVPLTLPFPFIYMSLPLFYIAYRCGVAGVVLANLLVSVNICVQIGLGFLVAPPTIYNWGYTLFYLPILATLIPPLMLAVLMDMNRSASAALLQSERRYRSLYQHTPAMLYSCDANGHIVTVNEVWLRTMGYEYEEVIGQLASSFLSTERDRLIQQEMLPKLMLDGECRNIRQQLQSKQGRKIDVMMTAALEKDGNDMPIRLLFVQLDISDQVRAEHLAYHDTLTQLPNRLLLTDRIEHACQQGGRNDHPFAVVFLDLDYFKEVNDELGHEVGDLLLIEVARRLERSVRSSDTISRLGGDEFVMLLNGLGPGQEAEQTAEKILQAIAQPYSLAGHQVNISVSMGLAYFPQDGRDGATLMRQADEAMYRAKRAGKNCFAKSDVE
ncbi:diguanylate cyclase domain-containing protein [Chitinibacter sp. GC72]|uniref:diguanylate cyclase domain-containing protein n=1 Tax=Chitinibacter sp. GC72 TaxID=1526917 RepID=UPI0012FC7273|nr:diguanylate cyclase [Chitinibacter sp. GC72]